MSTTNNDQIISHWSTFIIDLLENEIDYLSQLLILKSYLDPHSTIVLEHFFKLPQTGNIDVFLDNYRKSYYSKRCLLYFNLNDCLIMASMKGDLEIVHESIERGATNIEESLIISSFYGHTTIVKQLIPIISSDYILKIALSEASKNGFSDIVDLINKILI